MKLEPALVLVHFQMFSNVFPMFSQCRCFPCSFGPPLDPPHGPQPSRQVPPVICVIFVSLSCHFCRFHFPLLLLIYFMRSRKGSKSTEKQNISSFDIHLSVPYCVVIICISERALCMNEKKIVLANFCLGKLFL